MNQNNIESLILQNLLNINRVMNTIEDTSVLINNLQVYQNAYRVHRGLLSNEPSRYMHQHASFSRPSSRVWNQHMRTYHNNINNESQQNQPFYNQGVNINNRQTTTQPNSTENNNTQSSTMRNNNRGFEYFNQDNTTTNEYQNHVNSILNNLTTAITSNLNTNTEPIFTMTGANGSDDTLSYILRLYTTLETPSQENRTITVDSFSFCEINENNKNDISTLSNQYDLLNIQHFNYISSPLNDVCPITLERFHDEQEVIMISNCKHIYNKNSLIRWLNNAHTTCPNCRRNIFRSENDRNVDAN